VQDGDDCRQAGDDRVQDGEADGTQVRIACSAAVTGCRQPTIACRTLTTGGNGLPSPTRA
jgi:hypothetical protein